MHPINCNIIRTAQSLVILYLYIGFVMVQLSLWEQSDSSVLKKQGDVVLPVNQRVILAPVVLDLEHPDAWDSPLEVELDKGCRWRSLSRHHSLIHSTLHVACHITPVGPTSGRRGNVGRPRIRLLDVVGVVGDVREFDDDQVDRLMGFTSRVGGNAGEGACVFHSADEDVQGPVCVNQCSRGVGYQLSLRGDPVDGWLWVTSCFTPARNKMQHGNISQSTEWGQVCMREGNCSRQFPGFTTLSLSDWEKKEWS